jgi:HAD superfamily hydrolase (TIGR01509 family)
MDCIVLDAMGVLFRAADDVGELLIPFIAENGGETDEKIIQSAYMNASLGIISANEFWVKVKLDSDLEDRYLSNHELMPGTRELLIAAREKDIPVWCLSNDVGRWSGKLRANFDVEDFLAGSVISSDAGVRKPDLKIYEMLIERSGYSVEDIYYVDDRDKNIDAARSLGIRSIKFTPEVGFREITEGLINGAL